MDVGFKGFSGALALDSSTESSTAMALGILLRRGRALDYETKDLCVSRKLETAVVRPPHLEASFEGLTPDQVFMKSFINSLDQKFESRFDANVLKKSDLDKLLNVTSMRRSIVMPF